MTTIQLFDEGKILAKIAEGDERAFRIVYEKYYHNIYAFSLHLLKSDILAEEILQETFLKLWKLGRGATNIKNLENYLIVITRNNCLDILRKTKLTVNMGKTNPIAWSESHNETEERIFLNDANNILKNAINHLPPQQKLVYKLCQQDGLKYEEAAIKLNISPLTVQSYMKVALRTVRKYVINHISVGLFIIINAFCFNAK